ncbi:TPA: hypothetical protein ACTDLJ_004406 [Salmonella enterica subsp. enterica serovar Newport]
MKPDTPAYPVRYGYYAGKGKTRECNSTFIDSTSNVQMATYCHQYPGYFRFAKWMERLTQGIADGVIEVPKEHENNKPEMPDG